VDLATIDAIGVETIQVILSEYGPDLSRFPDEKRFVSHLRRLGNLKTAAQDLGYELIPKIVEA